MYDTQSYALQYRDCPRTTVVTIAVHSPSITATVLLQPVTGSIAVNQLTHLSHDTPTHDGIPQTCCRRYDRRARRGPATCTKSTVGSAMDHGNVNDLNGVQLQRSIRHKPGEAVWDYFVRLEQSYVFLFNLFLLLLLPSEQWEWIRNWCSH